MREHVTGVLLLASYVCLPYASDNDLNMLI
jgi:hypothetical protein